MIDLHSHTTFSDGEFSPEELLSQAAAAGIRTLAVTDHDTVLGLPRAQSAARRHGIELVPGIEISAHQGAHEIHVLGHFIDPLHPELNALAARLGEQRRERMQLMLERLRPEGIQLSLAQVETLAQGASLGRPHLARLLVQEGFCTSPQDAFSRYLGDNRPAHVPSSRMSAAEAIGLIHRAGGTATLAHPGVSKVHEHEVRELKASGLDGLEVFHPEQVPSQKEKLLRWTQALDLSPTAGSDFHGPQVSPRRQLGMESLTPAALEALRARKPPERFDTAGGGH